MKKIAIILVTVAVMIGLMFWADRATRKPTQNVSAMAMSGEAKPAPALKLKDLDGNDVALSDLKGKVVFINFWATWCGPCQDEIPTLINLQNQYASRGFTVLGIAMDEEGKSVVAPFVAKELYDVKGQKLHINYPILLGTDDASDKFGGILGYPTSFLISRNGNQIMKFQGPPDLDIITKAIESNN
ncbi:MAG TPA: TlpA disulfide reductase family protein [Candidatus Saccharimonadales bacterium]|nr:TlpA disulfide reductase family protein [Candidatus Saccharimonadales bacterium]